MTSDEAPIYVPDENSPELPLPPSLPAKPFTFEEAITLLDEVTDNFPNPHDALEELMTCGSSMFEDVEELVEGRLSGDHFAILVPILIQLAFVFAPPGTLQPELNLDSMEDALDDLQEENPDEESLISGSRQPHVLKAVLKTMTEFNAAIPKNQPKLKKQELQFISLLLRVITDEFDAALRIEGATRH